MTRTLAALLVLAFSGTAPAAKLTVKSAETPPPKDLAEPIRVLLESRALTVLDDGGKEICTVWPRKSVEVKAKAEQVKGGLRYSNIPESTVVGAVRFPAEWADYRKQKIKPGVYTLRMGMQPMDGDHMGTALYNEFFLLCPAGKDKIPGLLETEALHELSSASTTRKHPGVMMLFPNLKPAATPAAEERPQDHWVLSFQTPVSAGGEKATIGFSAVLVGHSMAE